MTEPGFPTLLAHPVLAFALAILAIGAAAHLALHGARQRSAGAQDRYWRAMGLLAEILLALGLIGLGVYAGRITLAANHVLLTDAATRARDAVDARLLQVTADYCVPAPAPASRGPSQPPFNPAIAARELCEIARARVNAGTPTLLDWQVTGEALRAFGGRYPGCVENVFSRNNDCESTVNAAGKLGKEVDTLSAAIQAVRADGVAMASVHGERDWGFSLLALFLASAGMAIRLARATAQWLDSHAGALRR